MRKDADKFLSNQGWIVDGPVDRGLMYCYNENKIKEPLQIKIRNNQIFECDMKSCSLYKMFRVCAHTLARSKKKGVFQTFIYKINCRGNSGVVSNIVNSGKKNDAGKKKSKSTQRRRGVANQPTQVIRNVVEPQHVAFEAPSVRVDERPAYPQPCQGKYVLALQRYCHPNVKSCYVCSKEIFRSDARNYDDIVIAGNTQRAIFDVQTQKYTVSPNTKIYGITKHKNIRHHQTQKYTVSPNTKIYGITKFTKCLFSLLPAMHSDQR